MATIHHRTNMSINIKHLSHLPTELCFSFTFEMTLVNFLISSLSHLKSVKVYSSWTITSNCLLCFIPLNVPFVQTSVDSFISKLLTAGSTTAGTPLMVLYFLS